MRFSVEVTGDDQTANRMVTAAAAVEIAVTRLITHWTQLLKTKIQANASGRPGPNAPTGDYRRSWTVSVQTIPGGAQGTAGTNRPQGPRLEYGFSGTDSLGRKYNQPPFPHVTPAKDEIEPQMVAAHEALVRTLG